MATNRGRDSPNRIIGLGSGSNDEGAIFALTFTAIDTIVIHLFELIFDVLQPVSTMCGKRDGLSRTSGGYL